MTSEDREHSGFKGNSRVRNAYHGQSLLFTEVYTSAQGGGPGEKVRRRKKKKKERSGYSSYAMNKDGCKESVKAVQELKN